MSELALERFERPLRRVEQFAVELAADVGNRRSMRLTSCHASAPRPLLPAGALPPCDAALRCGAVLHRPGVSPRAGVALPPRVAALRAVAALPRRDAAPAADASPPLPVAALRSGVVPLPRAAALRVGASPVRPGVRLRFGAAPPRRRASAAAAIASCSSSFLASSASASRRFCSSTACCSATSIMDLGVGRVQLQHLRQHHPHILKCVASQAFTGQRQVGLDLRRGGLGRSAALREPGCDASTRPRRGFLRGRVPG